jgi:hypothetical protein
LVEHSLGKRCGSEALPRQEKAVTVTDWQQNKGLES